MKKHEGEIYKSVMLSIRKKARKDARKNGFDSAPVRRDHWSADAWSIYQSAYLDEIEAMTNGY